jgi:hypothetical protein
MRSRTASHVEIVGTEGGRKKRREPCRHDVVARVNQEFVAAVLEEQLATASARRDGFAISRDNGRRNQSSAADADEVTHERALRAEGESVARVLYVGADDDLT